MSLLTAGWRGERDVVALVVKQRSLLAALYGLQNRRPGLSTAVVGNAARGMLPFGHVPLTLGLY